MDQNFQCRTCGVALTGQAVEGMCANCLLKLALEGPQSTIGNSEEAATTDATSPDPAVNVISAGDLSGSMIGRYKLLQKIGEGGMGSVYLAEQREPVIRKVALKIIKAGMDTHSVVARFEAERQALALMDHPNIAKVFDGGATESGRLYFVMELVRGTRITDYCTQAKLSLPERLKLFISVCQAIQHAHQKGIIHRDIKPSNILVTVNDGAAVPKVIDFGIAKATDQRLTDKSYFTEFQAFIGTPAYTSPEQAEMSSVDIDTRSDIYSLGVLLYELLTGQTPFSTERLLKSGLDEMRRIIREEEPERPSTRLKQARLASSASPLAPRPSSLASDLDWIVMKALEKDRARRYETAISFAQDIQRHLNNESVVACPPNNLYRARKFVRRNKLAVAAVGAVGAALLVGLGVSIWALHREHDARLRAVAAESEQRRERTNAERAGEMATSERNRAAKLLSQSQAEHGVNLLERNDPSGLLHLLEARRTVEHLPEERLRRTLLWSGWMESLPKQEVRILETTNSADRYVREVAHRWMGTNAAIPIGDTSTGAEVTRFALGALPVSVPESSADGRLLFVKVGGSTQLWDLAPIRTNQPPRRILSRIFRYAFDPTRRRVVTLANPGLPMPGDSAAQIAELPPSFFQVQVWDSREESPLVSTWEGDRDDLSNHQLALSSDGSKVAASWKSLTLWDARTGQPIEPSPDLEGIKAARSMFDTVCFSPDGRWLWEVWGTLCVRYDLATGKRVGEPIKGLHRWNRPWISPTGQHLVLSLADGFKVAQLNGGEYVGPLIPRDESASGRPVALNFDGRWLATAGPDRAVQVWDTVTGQPLGRPAVLPSPVASASFSPDGQWLTVIMHNGSAQMRRLVDSPSTSIQEWAGTQIIGFNQQGQLLTYVPSTQTMLWRNPETGQLASAGWMIPDRGPLMGAAVSLDGAIAATAIQVGHQHSVIRVWDTANGVEQGNSIAWTNSGALTFSDDSRMLAGVGGGDGSIFLWDLASRQLRSHMSWAQPAEVGWLGIRFSPDGRYLAARNSYALTVWDVAAGNFATGSPSDFYLAISQDWTLAHTARELLDFRDPRQPRPAPSPTTSRSAPAERGGMAISPDGRLRVADVGNKAFRLIDIATGRLVGQEIKTDGLPMVMTFSPDSRMLVIAARDLSPSRRKPGETLQVWETSTGLPCGRAVLHKHLVYDLKFDRAVRFLAVSSGFDIHASIILRLPAREIALEEMQRQSWLLAGSRLDETGNVEFLSAEEIRQLEAATPEPN